MPGQAILLIMNDVLPERESEFCRWCREEQIPAMKAVPGVLDARMYRALEGAPKYLTVYDLDNPGVLEQPEYPPLRGWGQDASGMPKEMFSACPSLTVGVYQGLLVLPRPEPTDLSAAKCLMLRVLEIDAEHQEEFQDWYNTEHVPNLVSVPGCIRGRRFGLKMDAQDNVGNPSAIVALYDVENPQVLKTEEWSRKVLTPWTLRLRRYYRGILRNVYERIVPE